jgi:hypothetical protein
MPQGWTISTTTEEITFLEAPAVGVNNIEVIEYAVPASGGSTDIFALSAWGPVFGYPSDVEFYSDRLFFARTSSQPQTIWASKIGNYVNFGKSVPGVDDDAITATLNARQVNAIADLVPLDKLIVLTTGGEWKTAAGQDDVLTPTTIAFKPQSYNGSSEVPALVIGNTALYVQNRGYVVRDIGYQFESDGYTGSDLTVFASHLTEGKPIIAWAYQQIPYSIVWAVREDGVLLALTYMKEQSVVAWTPMQIDGFVESICVVPEGPEDAVYVVVVRQGVTMIERLSTRLVTDVREGKFLDSSLSFDGRNTDADRPLTLLSGGTWQVGDVVSVTCGDAVFAPGDVGDYIVVGYNAGFNARLRITGYTAATDVTCEIETPIPAAYQAAATADWGFARDVITGLGHLAGRTVGILCDGRVQDERVVAEISPGIWGVTLDEHGVLVHVGLPYVSDFETLEINIPGGATTRLQTKIVKRVGLIVQDSRSIRAGATFDKLKEYEPRDVATDPNAPPALLNGCVKLWLEGGWVDQGHVCVRQSDPLPMAILGVIPEMTVGQL